MTLSKILSPGKKRVFYGRHSTDKQDILTQKSSVYKLAEEYRVEIVAEYIDEAVSATKKKMEERPQLVNLLRNVTEKKFDFIMVYKDDRLARHPMEHQRLRMFFIANNTPVIISNTKELYTNGDLLAQLMKDGFSKFEADNIRERTRDTFEAKIQKGEWTGGNPPYGYKKIEGKNEFEIVAEEALVVREIFDLYKKGEGFQAIASHLNKTVGDRKWTKEKVKFIVTNPFYTGYLSMGRIRKGSSSAIQEKKKWVMGRCEGIEPLISLQEWEYCWHMYQQKRKGEVQPKCFKTRYLLKDILYCKECQQPMACKNQMTAGKEGKRYGANIYLCKGCRLRCNADWLHQFILENVLASVFLRSHAVNDPLQQEIKEGFISEVEHLRENIAKLEEQIAKYAVETNRVEQEIKGMYKMDADEETQRLVKILFAYRIGLKKKMDQANKLIEVNKEKINYIENVEMDYEFWKEIFYGMVRSEYGFEDTKLRRLLLYVFDRVEISRDGEVSYKARVDLSPREYFMYGGFAFE